MHDITGDHLAGFYIAGTLILISGLILLLLPLVEHFQQKRKYDLEPSNKADLQSVLIGSIGAAHLALVWQLGSSPPDMTIDKPPKRNLARMSLPTQPSSHSSWEVNRQKRAKTLHDLGIYGSTGQTEYESTRL